MSERSHDRDPSSYWTLSRRHLLVGAATVGAATTVDGAGVVRAARALAASPQVLDRTDAVVQWFRRYQDGLALRFEFVNMERVPGQGRVRRVGTDPAYVVIVFPPQHIYEQAFFETQDELPEPEPGQEPPDQPTGEETPTARPVGARLAGESRLGFVLPAGTDELDLDADTLLDWVRWQLHVVPAAQPPGPRGPLRQDLYLAEPTPDHTAIELPWWLILSPHENSAWAHATDPVEHNGRTELWHTRLAARSGRTQFSIDEDDDANRTVRAVWARDDKFGLWWQFWQGIPVNSGPPNPRDGSTIPSKGIPFRSSLVPRDRFDIVISSADYYGHLGGPDYAPEPIAVNNLMLTPMGGWIDSQGQWDFAVTGTSLEDWTQRGTHGRDHYVRVIRAGFLAPFGHRCSLIKITERKFQPAPDGPGLTAYLRQRYYIVVRERRKDYFGSDPTQHDQGRRFPFRRVELLTLMSPNLDLPVGYVPTASSEKVFAPMVGGAPFRFHVRLTDVAGRRHDRAIPLVFVDAIEAQNSGTMQVLRDEFNAGTVLEPATTVHEFRERIAVAPPTEAGGDDTTLDVTRMTWGLDDPIAPPPATPLFTPTMQHADVRFAAAEVAAGSELAEGNVRLDPRYLGQGIDGVPGGVFVSLVDPLNPVSLGFGSTGNGDRVGGAVEPYFGITAVSRTNGVVGGADLDTLRDDTFEPTEFFGLTGSSFLGGIPLSAVLAPLTGTLADAPAIDHRVRRDSNGAPIASETRMSWRSELQAYSISGAPNIFKPRSDSGLTLDALHVTDLVDPSSSTSQVVGELRDFEVNLFGDTSPGLGFIGVHFDHLRFTSLDGSKPVIDVEISDVEFRDPLRFIDKLDPYLASAGLGGLAIDVAPTGVTAGYSLAIPSIEVGVFSLQNIAVSAGVTIPFTGDPVRMRFAFCTRENPFLLTVMCFGGGGFVGLAIGADGIEMVEASLEAKAQLSLDIGVASGSVHAALGLYFKVEAQQDGSDKVELTGYTRLGGKLRVMGIVSVSVEFYLGFTYDFGRDKVSGQATLTIEIDVLVFSGTVTMKVERRYGGSNDPTFGEMMSAEDWNEYAAAFAA